MIGTCTLSRIMNVIKESKMDQLSTPMVVVRMSSLLSQQGSVEEDPGVVASPLMGTKEVDEPVYIKESVWVGPFQTQILECRVKPLLGESAHVMVTPLWVRTIQPGGAQLLPPTLHVLHTYTWLKMSSSKVSVVRNMSESPVFLKKGVQVARLVSASPVELAELSPEM